MYIAITYEESFVGVGVRFIIELLIYNANR